MKINKLVLSLLAIFAVGQSGVVEKSYISAQEDVHLELFNIKTETRTQLEELVDYYEEQNPHVTINITTLGGAADPKAALQAQFSSGNEPHIFFSNGLSDTQKWIDSLADLSDLDIIQYAAEGSLDGAIIDGVVYGIPNNMEGTTLIVNEELLNKAGIEIDSIDSFESFAAAVETLDAQKAELGIDAVFAFPGKATDVIGQFGTHFLAHEFDNNTATAFLSENLEYTYGEDLKKYVDLIDQYGVQPIVTVDYSNAIEDYFVNERVAMVSSGNWIVPTLLDINPEFVDKITVLPYFVEGKEPSATVSNGWYWTVNSNKTEAEIEESKKFLNWMYSDEYAQTSLVKDFNYIPAYTNFSEETVSSLDNVSKGMFQFVAEGNNTVWVDSSYPDGWGANSFGPKLQQYWDEIIDFEEFKSQTSEDWNRMR